MKTIGKLLTGLAPIGMLIAIGSVGAIERNTVSIAQGFTQAVVGLAIALVGVVIGNFIEW